MEVAVRGSGGVAGEGRVVGAPNFNFWGKFTMPLILISTQIRCPMLPLACVLYYTGPLFRILGCNDLLCCPTKEGSIKYFY